ncbi:MAG: T9SS type B sorting domain-containing protein [Bacteroidales bacterium]|nr:T9SS type B sorting domain-containing protein [Bacteroidales bacterium]MBN2763930.1 T9SS type B sorting domain-containing protein [Bacteroidales bacterium]
MKEKLLRLKVILVSLSCFISFAGRAQIDFIVPDTVCIRDSMQAVNMSSDASSYYWNFCSGNLAYIPEGENLTNIGKVNGPSFIDIVKTAEGFYAFITNHVDGTLTRDYFGNSLLNEPVSVNLGNTGGISHLEGIQVVSEGDRWYGFVTGGIGVESSLIRLEFGSSPGNIPVVTNLGNIGELSYPIDFFMYRENDVWIGLTVNYTTNAMSRLVFSNGLDNPPDGENLGNPADMNRPCGLHAMLDNGNWFVFVTNFGSNTLSRIDFGASLLNQPSGVNIGGSGTLSSPFDLTMIRDCERIFGLVVNHYNSELVRIDFGDNIMTEPVYQNVGNIGDMYQPHGLSEVFRDKDVLYLLTANINNTLTRMYFPPCDNASISSSTDRNPPRITYNQPGEYNISLMIDEGLPTQEVLCRNIIVFNNPDISLGNDTVLLPGTTIMLSPGSEFRSYDWTTGESSSSVVINHPGEYGVEVTDSNGCSSSATINVSIELYIPEFFTPNGDTFNDTWEVEYFRINPNVTVEIFDRFGIKITSYRGSDTGWDGTYRGHPVKADSYWYVMTFDDGSKPLTGYVTVVR